MSAPSFSVQVPGARRSPEAFTLHRWSMRARRQAVNADPPTARNCVKLFNFAAEILHK
jgi:hypothetical protein